MNLKPTDPAVVDSRAAAEMDQEIREWVLRVTKLLGYPRSVGEIYGLLYVARTPLSMDQIQDGLSMSLGAASQGLKNLRGLRAVKTVYVPGKRKDFYIAETDFRHLVGSFLKEEVLPLLENNRERLKALEGENEALEPDLKEHYGSRLRQMKNLNNAARRLIPLLSKFLKD